MFGVTFRVQFKNRQKVEKCVCKSAAGSLQGCRTWYAAPTCGTLARTRVHFGQTHFSTFWRFFTKNDTKHPPQMWQDLEMLSYISQPIPLRMSDTFSCVSLSRSKRLRVGRWKIQASLARNHRLRNKTLAAASRLILAWCSQHLILIVFQAEFQHFVINFVAPTFDKRWQVDNL